MAKSSIPSPGQRLWIKSDQIEPFPNKIYISCSTQQNIYIFYIQCLPASHTKTTTQTMRISLPRPSSPKSISPWTASTTTTLTSINSKRSVNPPHNLYSRLRTFPVPWMATSSERSLRFNMGIRSSLLRMSISFLHLALTHRVKKKVQMRGQSRLKISKTQAMTQTTRHSPRNSACSAREKVESILTNVTPKM